MKLRRNGSRKMRRKWKNGARMTKISNDENLERERKGVTLKG